MCGVVPMILGRVVMFPTPGQPFPPQFLSGDPSVVPTVPPSLYNISLPMVADGGFRAAPADLGEFARGCAYDWCKTIPRIEIAQVSLMLAGLTDLTSCPSVHGGVRDRHRRLPLLSHPHRLPVQQAPGGVWCRTGRSHKCFVAYLGVQSSWPNATEAT